MHKIRYLLKQAKTNPNILFITYVATKISQRNTGPIEDAYNTLVSDNNRMATTLHNSFHSVFVTADNRHYQPRSVQLKHQTMKS